MKTSEKTARTANITLPQTKPSVRPCFLRCFPQKKAPQKPEIISVPRASALMNCVLSMNRYTNTENNIVSAIPHRLPKSDDAAIETAVLSHRLFLYFRIILSLIIIKRLRSSTRLTVTERQSLFLFNIFTCRHILYILWRGTGDYSSSEFFLFFLLSSVSSTSFADSRDAF